MEDGFNLMILIGFFFLDDGGIDRIVMWFFLDVFKVLYVMKIVLEINCVYFFLNFLGI